MNFKKSLGQNLLIDKNISKKILSLTSLKNKQVIEIGAGTGNLTKEILKKIPKEIICIEKDKVFVEKLKTIFKSEKKFKMNHKLVSKYFEQFNDIKSIKYVQFETYFMNFFNFCFELPLDNMIREVIKFKY